MNIESIEKSGFFGIVDDIVEFARINRLGELYVIPPFNIGDARERLHILFMPNSAAPPNFPKDQESFMKFLKRFVRFKVELHDARVLMLSVKSKASNSVRIALSLENALRLDALSPDVPLEQQLRLVSKPDLLLGSRSHQRGSLLRQYDSRQPTLLDERTRSTEVVKLSEQFKSFLSIR